MMGYVLRFGEIAIKEDIIIITLIITEIAHVSWKQKNIDTVLFSVSPFTLQYISEPFSVTSILLVNAHANTSSM